MNSTRARLPKIASALLVATMLSAPGGFRLEARSTPPGRAKRLPSSRQTTDKEAAQRIRETYARMSLRFEQAIGAKAGDTRFVARGDGYLIELDGGHARFALGPPSDQGRTLVSMRLAGGAATASGHGRDVLPGVTNYLFGNEPRKWRTGVRSYGKVEYRDVYSGVNIVYYGNGEHLEYDFVVAPGADYRAIALAFDGATKLSIDPAGDLVIAAGGRRLVQHAPVIYQEKAGKRRMVRGGYVLRSSQQVGFWVGPVDPHLPLIIDPVLTYSSYLGGDREERIAGVAFDAQGNMFLAGLTGAADFPVSGSPALAHGRDNWDAFVVKLNAAGDQFQYVTYLGGTGYDEPADLAVDPVGQAYVIGQTDSWDFPTVHALQASRRGFSDGFVTKLDPNGVVVYSTYVGGANQDSGTGIAVDTRGRAYVTGWTISADFPTVRALQASLGGSPAFRTTDGGTTWSGVSGLQTSYVQTFAVDPVSTATVYAGSGSDGVFRSTDGGSTWSATSVDLPPLPVSAMAVDFSGALYVANEAGVYRTRDQGVSWTDLQFWSPASSVVVDPGSNTVYVAGSTGFRQGVFKSTDGGDTWIDTGLTDTVTSLAVSQSVVFAGTLNGVFKSVAGSDWTPVTDGIHEAITSLAVDPHNPDVAYAGTSTSFFSTTSGGASWSLVLPLPVLNIAIASSNPSIVYLATQQGAGMTDDGGVTWRSAGPAGGNISFFAIDPADSTRVYGASAVGWDLFVARIAADGSALEYSTYLGGSGSESYSDIAIDSSGSAYIAAITQSTDFPVRNPYQPTAGGLMDVVVAKLSDAGTLAYATYLGGHGSDYFPSIAVDGVGQAHVTGITLSLNFPTANAHQPTHGGGFYDIFVTALNAAGNGLVFSTYLGGSNQETWWQSLGPAIAVGPSGDTFVTGATTSTDFPTREAIQSNHAGGGSDAFVASFNASGQLLYSTYVGGSGADYGTRLAVDPAGAVAVAGGTNSNDFWTRQPLQSAKAGAEDVFVARIADGTPPEDTTPPTTTMTTSGTPGLNGWFTSSVEVGLNAADDPEGQGVAFIEYSLNGSAFQRYSAPFAIAMQGTTVIRARAMDKAGNVENPGASRTITIDSESPVISVSSPTATDYLHSDAIRIEYGAADSTSGLAATSPRATLDGIPVTNGQTVQLLTLALGPHTLAIIASDQAGNTSTQTIELRVIATLNSLIAAVNAFAAEGELSAQATRALLSKLEDARQAVARGNTSAARGALREFSDYVSAQSGKSISPRAAQVLLADVTYVLGTL